MEIYLIILMLVFSAFFSGIEIAFITANRLHVELMKQQGRFSSRLLAFATSSTPHFLGTTLIGNNIALILISILMARALEPFIHNYLPSEFDNDFSALVIETVFTTAIVLVFGDYFPKALFRVNANNALRI